MSDNLLQTFLDQSFPADKSRTFLIERDGTERSFSWLLDRTGRYAAVLADPMVWSRVTALPPRSTNHPM